MGGQMGNKKVTIQNLRITEVLPEKNILLLGGAVPGSPDGHVVVKHAVKRPYVTFSIKSTVADAQPTTGSAETQSG
jgi:ribosomal protein L3